MNAMENNKIGSFNRYRVDEILFSLKATCEEIYNENRNVKVRDLINSINDNNVYIHLNCDEYRKYIKIGDLNLSEEILDREVANSYTKTLIYNDDSYDLIVLFTYEYPKAVVDDADDKYYIKKPKVVKAHVAKDAMEIETKEGIMKANVGDWIITGTKNELYPCKPEVFEDVYRPLTKFETWFYTKILRRK